MPAAGHVLTFALTAVVIILIPGPSVMFVVGRALTYGRRAAMLTVVGNTLGEYVQVVAVAFGIGAVAERSVAVLTGLKLFGAAYLIYLGLKAIRERRSMFTMLPQAEIPSQRRFLLQGFLVGASNPKTVVFPVRV
jgi:threonine/homoserine/homoserine lactone efflux protein